MYEKVRKKNEPEIKCDHRELKAMKENEGIGAHMLGGRDSFVVKKINIFMDLVCDRECEKQMDGSELVFNWQ